MVKVLKRSASSGKIEEENLTSLLDILFPVGTIVPWVYGNIPLNFLEVNGQTVNKVDYPILYDLWGPSADIANTDTTLTLPDFTGVPLAQGASPALKIGNDTVDASHAHGSSGAHETWTTPLTTGAPSATSPATSITGSVGSSTHTHAISGGAHVHPTDGSTTLNIKQKEGRISAWIVRAK